MAFRVWAAFDRLLAADLNAALAALGGAAYGCAANSVGVAGIVNVATKLPMTVGGPNLNGGDYLVPAGGAGVYFVSGTHVTTAISAGTSNSKLEIRKNGVTVATGSGRWEAMSVVGTGGHWCGYVTLAVGDRLSLWTNTASGAVSMTTAGYMYVRRIADALA